MEASIPMPLKLRDLGEGGGGGGGGDVKRDSPNTLLNNAIATYSYNNSW